MILKHALPVLAAAALVLSGCTPAAKNVSPTYTAATKYDGYACSKLIKEVALTQTQLTDVTAAQNKRATTDKAAATAAVLFFVPALILIRKDKENTAELARLKGEYDALKEASIAKSCDIAFDAG